ncbi:hypothetical protein O3M35_011140 [Rhynocoris fuscipes]|uniref:Nicotinamide riboside kinase 1 n=1 Tax=Rhynocoris fuscipes TaxID=488301 RepID=A0AAW1D1X6_9HEMI
MDNESSNSKWIVVAVAGATNSGKTTLANRLEAHFVDAVHIGQDAYFIDENDPRHVKVESLGHNNWEKLTALDMDKMVEDVLEILKSSRPCTTPRLLILDGFLILNDPRISSLCHLKFYIDISYEECRRRRLSRTYDPPDVPGYFEQIVWPESRLSKEQALADNPDTILLSGELPIQSLLTFIINIIEDKINNQKKSA